MTRFSTTIADHLASQGESGLQLADGRFFTLDELRSLSAGERGLDREQAWAIVHKGERIRRPRGRTVYTVDGYEQAATSFGPSWLIRLRKDDGAFVCVGYTEVMMMVPEDAPVPPPAARRSAADAWTCTTVDQALRQIGEVYGGFTVRREGVQWRAQQLPPEFETKSRQASGLGRTIADAIINLANDGNKV